MFLLQLQQKNHNGKEGALSILVQIRTRFTSLGSSVPPKSAITKRTFITMSTQLHRVHGMDTVLPSPYDRMSTVGYGMKRTPRPGSPATPIFLLHVTLPPTTNPHSTCSARCSSVPDQSTPWQNASVHPRAWSCHA